MFKQWLFGSLFCTDATYKSNNLDSIMCVKTSAWSCTMLYVRGVHLLLSNGTQYFQCIGTRLLILNILVLFCFCFALLRLLYFYEYFMSNIWICNNLQKLNGWYSVTIAAMLRCRYFCKKYRQFCIAIQRCPAMVMTSLSFTFIIIWQPPLLLFILIDNVLWNAPSVCYYSSALAFIASI